MLSADLLDLLRPLHPDPARELAALHQQAGVTVDSALLDLCASAIDAALDERNWQPPRTLTAKEQAFLAFTEQFVVSVSTLSSEQVESLRPYATADEIYNFTCALYVIDMTSRLNLVVGRLLS